MLGTPLKAFYATADTAAKVAHNEAMIAEFLTFQNKYVEYVVVNGKLVYIANEVAATNDVVVIDYFTNISEDGIEAYAWSTATNSYDIIKIAEFNGWNVGGFDWRDYYFNSIFGGFNGALGGTTNLESLLPVKAGDIYLACSDGLWEFATPETLAEAFNKLANPLSADEEPLGNEASSLKFRPGEFELAAKSLAQGAKDQGSGDDITLAILACYE
jgi:hypothetical protein